MSWRTWWRVCWKRQGEWREVYQCSSAIEAFEYARERIAHSGITERIEVREGNAQHGVAIYDKAWETSK